MAEIDIHPIVPDNYNPGAQIVSWADIMPNFNLPSGKTFILGKGPEWNVNQVLTKGMTHIPHGDVSGISQPALQALKDQGRTYHSVPITPELIGIGANGPDEWVNGQYNRKYFPNGLPDYNGGFALGDNCNIDHAFTIAETMENLHYTPPSSAFWGGFYERKSQRLDARFGPGNWKMCHDYLFIKIGPGEWSYTNENQARNYFRNLPSLPNYDYTQNTLKRCNLYTSGVYLGGMDRDKWAPYNIALDGRMYQALGKDSVAFFDNEHEWQPNNKNGYVMPEGILYRENKFPVADSVAMSCVITGLHFADGFVSWGSGGKVTNKKWSTTWMQVLANGSFWVKNGETEKRPWQTWPHLSGGEDYNIVNWTSNIDASCFAAYAYAATLGQCAGGITKAARYKINNGAWYNPQNTYQDDLCYAKYHSAPMVETVVKDGKEALIFSEPCSNNKKKMITIEGQTGNTYSFEACGDIPHLALTNI